MTQYQKRTILLSILRWILLAVITGIVVGTAVSLLINALMAAIKFTSQFPYYFLALPLVLVIIGALIKLISPESSGNGTDKAIEAVHKRSGNIPFIVVPTKFLGTIVTIAAGGSAGHEGPAAQIGAGIISKISDTLKFEDHDRKKLVICGISAAFAAVFGTPLTGAVFGVEVLFISGMLYEMLLPSIVAGVVSFHVVDYFGALEGWNKVAAIASVPALSPDIFLFLVAAGVFFGLCSLLFIEFLLGFPSLLRKIQIPEPVKNFLFGTLLVLLTLFFSTDYLGLSTALMESSLNGEPVPGYAFVLKTLFTGITLSIGGSGGILAPIMVIGSSAGNFFGQVFGLNIALFAALGMVSVLAGSTNTPIAASIMAIEWFGPAIAPYAAICCFISFMMSGDKSALPAQIIAASKTSFIHMKLNWQIGGKPE